MVSRLLLPRGRGELAILLTLPNAHGSVLQPRDTASNYGPHFQRRRGHTRGSDDRFPARRGSGSRGGSALHVLRAVDTDRRQSSSRSPGRDILRMRRLHDPCAVLQRYGLWLERFTWVNSVTLAGQAGYVVALFILWSSGTLTPLSAALSALASQLLQCLLHLIHIKPWWLNRKVPRGAYSQCLGLALRFAAPSLAVVVLSNADCAILRRTTTLEQIGYFAIAFAVRPCRSH